MGCATGNHESDTPFMLPTRSLDEQIAIQHAGRDSPAAVKFIVVDVRVELLLMGLNCIVYWLQVIRMSAVGFDFVIVSLSEQDFDKIGPIANPKCVGLCVVIVANMDQTSAGD
jgi:hypothetical protein